MVVGVIERIQRNFCGSLTKNEDKMELE